MKRSHQGFSLTELLIAIAVVGILAAVAVPSYQSYVKRAEFAQVIEDFDALKLAIELCWELEGDLRKCDKSYGEIGAAVNGLPGVDVRFYGNSQYTKQVRLYSMTVDLSDGTDAGIQYGAAAIRGGTLNWAITENSSTCLQEGICSL